MRPLQLMMTAFGPYAGKELIDFRELGQDKIFVISGKTGSGKTTIFDAMSFALFGKANTDDRDGLSLRSHFAKEESVTEAALTFSVRNKTYIIIRQPQQEISKRNGEGTRIVNATAVLYEIIDGEQQLLASSVRDVDLKIAEIIQLNVEQFRQILMIPQGEFRELLVAPSKEKQVILQKLAHTTYYKKIEEILKEKQKKSETEIAILRQEIQHGLVTIFDKEQIEGKSTAEINSIFQTEMTEKAAMKKQASEALSILQIKLENATKDLTLAESRLQDWNLLDTLDEELASLEKQASIFQEKKNLSIAAKRANNLKGKETILQEIRKQKQQLEIDLIASQKNMEVTRDELLTAKKEKELKEHNIIEQNEREKRIYYLEELESKIERLARSEKELKRFETMMSELLGKQTEIQDNMKQLLLRKESFQEEEKQIQTAQLTRRDIEAVIQRQEQEHNNLLAELEQYEEKEKLAANLLILREEMLKAISDYEFVLDEVTKIEMNTQQHQAALLAENLVDGEPCPVCGAHHHPTLAVETVSPGEMSLESAKQLLAEALEVKQTKELETEKIVWQLEQIQLVTKQTKEEISIRIALLVADMKKEKEKLAITLKTLASEDATVKSIAWINKELHDLNLQLEQNQIALNETKGPAQQTLALVEMLKMEIPTEFTNSAVFYQKLELIKKEAEKFALELERVQKVHTEKRDAVNRAETLFNTLQVSLQKAEAEAVKQENNFEKELMQFDFKSYEAYQKASLTFEEIEQLDEEQATYEQTKFYTLKTREDVLVKLAGTEKPDAVSLKVLLATIQNEKTAKEEQLARDNDILKRIENQYENYSGLYNKIIEAEKQYAELGELSEMATGKNSRSLGFERYVLGAFLDAILERANVRLSKMTSGRFLLNRKVEKAKHNAQSGLDLVVYDEYTGKPRDVTTLSGGESFKTSLALALALAEVVQEMSGGISLETMFIDEGFGTLDSESLDAAVECLLETQQNGRLVGIISHVPELKERMGVRLEVTATNHGSTAAFIR